MSEILFVVEWTDQIGKSTCLGPGFTPRKGLKIVRGTQLKLVFPDSSELKVHVKRYPKKVKTAPITLRENYVIPKGTQVTLESE